MSNTVGYSLGCVTPVRYNLTQGEDATGDGVSFALPGCAPLPDRIPDLTWDASFSSSSPTLIGFSELAEFVSSPPKKYLQVSGSGDGRFRALYPDGVCGGTAYSGDGFQYSGAQSYDPVTGVLSGDGVLTVYQGAWPNPPVIATAPLSAGWPPNPQNPIDSAGVTDFRSAVLRSATGLGVCYVPSDSPPSAIASGSTTIQIDVEDTEDNAIARDIPVWSEWVRQSDDYGWRTVRTSGFSFSLKRERVRVYTPVLGAVGLPNTRLYFHLHRETAPYGGPEEWTPEVDILFSSETDGDGRLPEIIVEIPSLSGFKQRVVGLDVTS